MGSIQSMEAIQSLSSPNKVPPTMSALASTLGRWPQSHVEFSSADAVHEICAVHDKNGSKFRSSAHLLPLLSC